MPPKKTATKRAAPKKAAPKGAATKKNPGNSGRGRGRGGQSVRKKRKLTEPQGYESEQYDDEPGDTQSVLESAVSSVDGAQTKFTRITVQSRHFETVVLLTRKIITKSEPTTYTLSDPYTHFGTTQPPQETTHLSKVLMLQKFFSPSPITKSVEFRKSTRLWDSDNATRHNTPIMRLKNSFEEEIGPWKILLTGNGAQRECSN